MYLQLKLQKELSDRPAAEYKGKTKLTNPFLPQDDFVQQESIASDNTIKQHTFGLQNTCKHFSSGQRNSCAQSYTIPIKTLWKSIWLETRNKLLFYILKFTFTWCYYFLLSRIPEITRSQGKYCHLHISCRNFSLEKRIKSQSVEFVRADMVRHYTGSTGSHSTNRWTDLIEI